MWKLLILLSEILVIPYGFGSVAGLTDQSCPGKQWLHEVRNQVREGRGAGHRGPYGARENGRGTDNNSRFGRCIR
jgi:hypothetical protein